MSSLRPEGKLNKNRSQDSGMKLAALASLLLPGMAFAAWTTADFRLYRRRHRQIYQQNEVSEGYASSAA
jgi:hypothetical protein